MAKATINIPQFAGAQQVLRKIEPTANYVLGFDADKKLTAISGDSIVEAGEVTLTGAQELSGPKTLVSPVIKTGLAASGSAANTFAASTGTFITSTGANTLSGDVGVAAGKDVVFAAGDGALDASLGTGVTKTTSGANTLSGDVSVAGGKDVVFAAGDGALDASLGTGATKTTTGANTLSGDVSVAAGKDIVYAAGDGAFDASLGTGIFKTPTGQHTLGGAVNTASDITFTVAGRGPVLKQGANSRVGTFVLNGATPVAVSNSAVAITDIIAISLNTVGGTVGVQPHVATITDATGFDAVGTAGDTSTYNYVLIKSAA